MTHYEVQIKQRGGKWRTNGLREHTTLEQLREAWGYVTKVIRVRKARAVRIENGVATVLARYEPSREVQGGF